VPLVLALYVAEGKGVPETAAITAALGVPDDGRDVFEIGRAETGATCLVQRVEEAARAPEAPATDPADWILSDWRIVLPTVRAPWSARDLIPTIDAAAPPGTRWRALAPGLRDGGPPLEAWTKQHRDDLQTLRERCEAAGAPLPPHAPASILDAVHESLVEIARLHDDDSADDDDTPLVAPPTVHALVPMEGGRARFAVRLMSHGPRAFVPTSCELLFDPDAEPHAVESPRLFERELLADLLEPARAGDVVDVVAALERLTAQEGEALAPYRFVTPVEVVDEESLDGLG
jgi:hypothetical protein